LDYKKWKDGYYFKLRITLKDNTVLFVKEYADEAERNYSFHWQDAENKLMNSPDSDVFCGFRCRLKICKPANSGFTVIFCLTDHE